MPTFAPGRSRPEDGCHQALGLVVQVPVTSSKMRVPSVPPQSRASSHLL